MCREVIAATLVSTCLGLSSSARAEPPRSAPLDPVAAEALFEDGRRALEKNDLLTACAKFEESQKLDPSVGTLMNWATCEARRGNVATAWQRWRQALDQLPVTDDRVQFAKQQAAALEPRLPRLSIALTQRAPRGSRVLRDGVLLGNASLGALVPVDPGVRTITVRASGFAPRSFRIAIAEGEQKRVEVEPGKALPPEPRRESAEAHSSARGIGWALIGVGGAGVVTGVVTGLMLSEKKEDVDANCAPDGCNEAGLEAASQGKTLLVINAVAWGAGVAGLGIGAYVVLSSKRESSALRDARAARSPSFGVVGLARGVGVAYRSRF